MTAEGLAPLANLFYKLASSRLAEGVFRKAYPDDGGGSGGPCGRSRKPNSGRLRNPLRALRPVRRMPKGLEASCFLASGPKPGVDALRNAAVERREASALRYWARDASLGVWHAALSHARGA